MKSITEQNQDNKNIHKNLEFYLSATEKGDHIAQYKLGCMYRDGEGVVKDYNEAIKWFRKAADQGESEAYYNLGCLYVNGEGIGKDYNEALKWFRKEKVADKKAVNISKNTLTNNDKTTSQNEIGPHLVQSCITNINFPQTIDELLVMVEKNIEVNLRLWTTDIELLTDASIYMEDENKNWTSPKWLTQGDILFFYYSVTAKQRITKLLKQARQTTNIELIKLLERSSDLANRYSGTIFGCAEVSGSPEYYEQKEETKQHYKSRIFAPLKGYYIFNTPVKSGVFTKFLKISRQGTITILGEKEFEGIKQLLSECNKLPEFLQNAKFGGLGFRDVNKDNWISIACNKNAKFIHEIQLRSYFLDYLLDELKDERTPVVSECRCYKSNKITGFSDYFVQIHGKWIPIEAKLNVLSERDIISQISKYTHINTFIPSVGTHKGIEFCVHDVSTCIIIDQLGIYVTSNGEFKECEPGSPIWKREELEQNKIIDIRNYLQKLF
ncbi:MAG: tetratricopeptide repeat protein [Candidatus Brocadiales bacterium]|nr:tetratricopeptide repeat protein [Candidatus Brocadiales bacterium]